MLLEKKRLSLEEMEAQTALELPNRDLLALINVFIVNTLNNLTVSIPVKNNNVAVQICAVVNILNTNVGTALTCQVTLVQ